MKDLTGQKFGRWTVLRLDEKRKYSYICCCECGVIKSVQRSNLVSDVSCSCGCLRKELAIKHKMCETREYATWTMMKTRCLNSQNKDYKNYGGRGIKICKRWLDSFENFYEDMGNRGKGMSLDRIENSKGYSKSNCAWRSTKEQCRNKRTNINIIYNGKKQCISAWAEELGIKYKTLYNRIKRYNWSVERALTK